MRKQWPPDWWLGKRRTVPLFLALVLCGAGFWSASPAAAANPPTQEKTKVESKAFTGELGYLSPARRVITVETRQSGGKVEERYIPFDEATQFEHVRGLGDLKRGDTVRVLAQETYRESEPGQWRLIKTVATQIALVRSASPTQLGSGATRRE